MDHIPFASEMLIGGSPIPNHTRLPSLRKKAEAERAREVAHARKPLFQLRKGNGNTAYESALEKGATLDCNAFQ